MDLVQTWPFKHVAAAADALWCKELLSTFCLPLGINSLMSQGSYFCPKCLWDLSLLNLLPLDPS